MQCPTCGSENAADHRFCAACGAALPRACPACGFTTAPGARFCGGCGAALGGRPGAAGTPAPALPEDEHRQVTVLFADLCGFTRMGRELDPEEVCTVLDRFFGAADAAVERFGGTVDKHVGDAVMALFGAPIAHGDDPERAVRAALALHDAARAAGEAAGRPLAAHVGVACGHVVAGARAAPATAATP